MTQTRASIVGVLALALYACGGGTAAPDVERFKQLNESLSSQVTAHCANTAAMADMTACTAERDRYLGAARNTVEQMTALSTSMDDCMMSMGRVSSADMHDTCVQMSDELDAHMTNACASTDLAVDKAEADRHCAQLQSLIQVQLERADSMMQGGGGMTGTMSGGTCHR